GNLSCHEIGLTSSLVAENRAVYVIDRKDQVVACELPLTLEKPLELTSTGGAVEKRWRYDRDQECRRIERFIDAKLPLLAPTDVVAVLEDVKGAAGLHAHLAAEARAELAQPPILVLVVEPHITQKRDRFLVHIEKS